MTRVFVCLSDHQTESPATVTRVLQALGLTVVVDHALPVPLDMPTLLRIGAELLAASCMLTPSERGHLVRMVDLNFMQLRNEVPAGAVKSILAKTACVSVLELAGRCLRGAVEANP